MSVSKTNTNIFKKVMGGKWPLMFFNLKELRLRAYKLYSNSDGQKTLIACTTCAILSIFLLYIVSVTHSLIITGVAFASIFSLFSLLSALVGVLASSTGDSTLIFFCFRFLVILPIQVYIWTGSSTGMYLSLFN